VVLALAARSGTVEAVIVRLPDGLRRQGFALMLVTHICVWHRGPPSM